MDDRIAPLSVLFFKLLIILIDNKIIWMSIRILLPKIASRFGVIPHSEIRKIMAESATPFIIMVTTDRLSNIQRLSLFDLFPVVSITENKIKAITPINKILKSSRNSRSYTDLFLLPILQSDRWIGLLKPEG